MFFLKCLVIATVTTAFIGVWQNFYCQTLFSGKGNYLLVFLYVAVFVIFGSIYDGFKVGIMRVHELVYSLSLAVFFSNVFIYIILSLDDSVAAYSAYRFSVGHSYSADVFAEPCVFCTV